MVNAISSALSGLQNATQRVNKSADNIANLTTNDGVERNLAEDIVNLNIGELEFKANAIVLETIKELDDELGRIFDQEV